MKLDDFMLHIAYDDHRLA